MNTKLQKHQGAGNNFIITDNRISLYDFSPEIVEFFCNRLFGVGTDGSMLPKNAKGYDFNIYLKGGGLTIWHVWHIICYYSLLK